MSDSELRDFVFVMREDEVDATGVDVERRAEVLDRHHGTLDVPARAAWTDRRVPIGLTFFGGFPEREITGVGLFVLVDVRRGRQPYCR